MCGLAGAFRATEGGRDELLAAVDRMSATLRHRGPDDAGAWIDDRGQIGIGFRRLSILDLSSNGHQPMTSPSGRYTVAFNGEIYNHLQLRAELSKRGYSFCGGSDTETICAALDEWGPSGTVTRCIGMFAIAAWDSRSRSLSLIRDRLGIKPLYLYRAPGLVLFASELKALRAHPAFRADLDDAALESFLRYLYIPAPATIFRQVTKVRPGHIVTVSDPNEEPESVPFWSLKQVYDRARGEPFEGSEREAIDELERLLGDAVEIRKLSDVPLGALLSGGIDSSTVVALMQRGATRPTRTFSIGFTTSEHDESVDAARIATHLGTDHTTLMLDGSDALAVVPELPRIFDEPLADPSQIPTLLVSRLARRDVTVALTGDGGDEVFGGYNRYIEGHRMIPTLMSVPTGVRRLGSRVLANLADDLYGVAAPVMRGIGQQRLGRQKLGKLSRIMRQESEAGMYRSLLSAWQDPGSVVQGERRKADPIEQAFASMETVPLMDRMMLVDQAWYLPDDLLAKVDRASMAASLEARVPLLDHRVIEFAWRLPGHFRIRGREGKWLLRQVLYRHVPREMVTRPKVGFSVPIDEWLRGPLRPWAEDLLASVEAPLSSVVVQDAWRRFQAGAEGLGLAMWAVVMFQAWRNAWDV